METDTGYPVDLVLLLDVELFCELLAGYRGGQTSRGHISVETDTGYPVDLMPLLGGELYCELLAEYIAVDRLPEATFLWKRIPDILLI